MKDIADAPDVERTEAMKAKRLREILDEKSGGNFVEMLSKKIK